MFSFLVHLAAPPSRNQASFGRYHASPFVIQNIVCLQGLRHRAMSPHAVGAVRIAIKERGKLHSARWGQQAAVVDTFAFKVKT